MSILIDSNTKVICPITDAFVGHHGSLGGFVRVHCFNDVSAEEAMDFIRPIEGIEVIRRGGAAVDIDFGVVPETFTEIIHATAQ